ncbi:iron-containing alcohol dehydrogenase [Candidatus Bathyarchaeota archaeon]|nr:iron-containing alcohol dehydrogenase [Candidatus Bathyarchaeota archaeon]
MLKERFLRTFSYVWGPQIEFGCNSIQKLKDIVESMNTKKVLLITDKGIINVGFHKMVKELLEDADAEYEIYDKVMPNPLDSIVEDGAALAKKVKPDLILGLGGGSVIDTAKGISLLTTNPGSIREYEVRSPEDFGKIKNYTTPLITIPTTSGTGSEANFWAIITNTEKWNKMAIGGPPSYPGGPCIAAKIAILDPLLTKSLPPKQTAVTGIDALTHAIEAYTAAVANPVSDALAEYAIRVIGEYLPIAYGNGNDIEAREMMTLAACLAGISFSNSDCAGVHCLGEALGGVYGNPPKPVIPHGLACSLFLPWVMEYNYITDPVKFANIAKLLGENIEGVPLMLAAKKSIDAVKQLIKTLELPSSLKELKVVEEDLPRIAERATWNVSVNSNPRPLKYEDFLTILNKAYVGWQ